MKIAILCLFVLFGLVKSELCANDGRSCAHETCTSPQVPVCLNHVCTCDAAPTTGNHCQYVSDCEMNGYWRRHHCNDRDRHCFDGRCSCRHI